MDFRIPTFLVLFFILVQTCSSSFPIAKPGCPELCGKVRIPYPFGMTKECMRDEQFRIDCNNVTKIPTYNGTEIRNISLEGQLRISYPIAYQCNDPVTNNRVVATSSSSLLSKVMRLNREANKFTAIGCNMHAMMQSIGPIEQGYTTGCMSVCDQKEDVVNGSCSGIGCCQTPILGGGPWNLSTTWNNFKNHSGISNFSPCSYAFVVEESDFQFSADLLTSMNKNLSVPAVVDWVVESQVTCAQAWYGNGGSAGYACKTMFSVCYDPDGSDGYRCICNDGFEGNPYLPDNGCKDINECANMFTNECGSNSNCINTPGSYRCECKPGYRFTGKPGYQTVSYVNNKYVDCEPNKKNYGPAITVVSSVASILLLLVAIFTSCKVIKKWQNKKRRNKFFKRNGGLLLQGQLSCNEKLVHKAKIFSAKELSKASDGFNPNRVLGEGGQGTVYKGMLTDGTIVAIKKAKSVDEDQVQQFINEVIILSQVIHKNVVKLLGCCLETEVPLLVYEFVPNGTLYSLIHNNNDEVVPLIWSTRLRIAREVASALAYLHSSITSPIFHKDIKSLNILMDEKFRAKVSDFGTSRSVEIDKTRLTTCVQGTFGYIDPEFFQSNQFTDKSDVYSFGVVLIELLTRQKPISARKGSNDNDLSLVRRFLESMKNDCLKMVLDPGIIEEKTEEKVVIVAKLAGRCVHLNGKMRPGMKDLAMELENIKKLSKMDSVLQPQYSPSSSYIEEDYYGDMSIVTSGSTQSDSYAFPLLYDTV